MASAICKSITDINESGHQVLIQLLAYIETLHHIPVIMKKYNSQYLQTDSSKLQCLQHNMAKVTNFANAILQCIIQQ